MDTIEVDGIALACRVDGPEGGEAVLLSNSLAAALAMWEPHPDLYSRAEIRYTSETPTSGVLSDPPTLSRPPKGGGDFVRAQVIDISAQLFR